MSGVVFGVKAESLAAALRRMASDVNTLYPGKLWAPATSEVRGWGAKALHDHMQGLGDYSANALTEPTSPNAQPKTKFGKAVLTASKTENLSVYQRDSICIESELRLHRSLRFHNPTTIADKGYEGFPSTIILDTDGLPVGYEKSSGNNTTYLWSPATIETQAGLQSAPGDSFAYIRFNDEMEDFLYNSKAGLVAVRANIDVVEQFGVASLSAATHPPAVRLASAMAAAEMEPKLSENIADALTFRPDDIKARVGHLMASGLVEVIN